jgi:virginiamycin B lyase
MTTTTRLANSLMKLSFGAMAGISLLVLPAMAHAKSALTGTVSSAEEGKMEGVVVSAKRPGSTIMVSVSTNAAGEYRFPEDRLLPGEYDITMRAAGYTLPPTKAKIHEEGEAKLDLKLAKAAPNVLALQLTNSEWMQSAPGTEVQKLAFLRCLDCHGFQRPIFSKENAEEMAYTVQRMGAHSANASPNFPFFHQNASELLSVPPSKANQAENASKTERQLDAGYRYHLRPSRRRRAPRHAAR